MKLVLLSMLFLSPLATLAATTGGITISGVVPASTSITVTPLTGYNAIDFTAGASNLAVASVREKNNKVAGYVVTMASANAGKFKNGSNELVYTARYNGVAATLSVTPQTVTSQGSQLTPVNTLKALDISFTSTLAEDMLEGTYSDTLTFTITAN